MFTSKIHGLNVCWNSAFIKIFGYKHYESVKGLTYIIQRVDFKKLYDLKRFAFY